MTDPVPTAMVLAPAEHAVAPPTEGVSSHTVVTGPGGLRVVVLGFAAGAELAAHRAPRRALLEIMSGELELTLGDQIRRAPAGTWVYMDAGLVHAVAAPRPATMRLTLLPD
jgi:quercetin dioxygenase-like cupin family protein